MATKQPAPVKKTTAGDPRASMAPAAKPPVEHNPMAPKDAQGSAPPQGDGDQPRARKRIEEEKVSVTVHTAYNLTLDNGTVVRYHQGVQDMPLSHAEHFYSKPHIDTNE